MSDTKDKKLKKNKSSLDSKVIPFKDKNFKATKS